VAAVSEPLEQAEVLGVVQNLAEIKSDDKSQSIDGTINYK
jgi:hypothetical protein